MLSNCRKITFGKMQHNGTAVKFLRGRRQLRKGRRDDGILQQLFNAADIAVVGNYAGKEAMAAVGCNSPVVGLLVNLFVGISLGSNVMIAKSIGQGDKKSVSRTVHTSVIIALLGGFCIALLGELFAAYGFCGYLQYFRRFPHLQRLCRCTR